MIAAVVYASFGPFHEARLEAAGAWGAARGDQLVGIEVAGAQRDYRWPASSRAGQRYRSVRLFPDRDYWSLPAWRIERALSRALDAVRPEVVVLPGWGFRESLAGLS